ncbi:MAG: DUF1127 domain-containing protein [Pseudomonadota bacterium]
MAAFDHVRSAQPLALGAVFSNLLGAVVAWNDQRVTAKALNQLSDRELDDIGLVRADIDAVSRRVR